MVIKYGLRPYWDGKIHDYIQRDRMSMFYAQIYPIWARIVTDDAKNDVRGTNYVSELEILHKCDKKIHQSGYRPDRLVPQGERENKKNRVMKDAQEVSMAHYD